MQTTSQTWQSLFATGARLEARATIGETVYSGHGITAPVIYRALMGDALGAGNAVSASCSLSLRAPGTVAKAAAVAVEMRLTDGSTSSEWLPAGTFYVSRRSLDPVSGRLTLECYDALLKANALWEPSAGSWPRSMASVAAELATLLGVQQDSRNVIHTGTLYQITEPAAGATVRDVLAQIGAAHGGNWIITPANELRLVPVPGGGGAVTVLGVLGGMGAGPVGAISGVRCVVDGQTWLTGDETGAVLALNNGIGAWCAQVGEDLIGQRWQAFALSSAVYDPAVELGDTVTAGANGEAVGPLCRETVTLGALPRGDIAAPGTEEAADEYPYIGQAARTLTVAKAYADQVTGALDDSLTQQDIFNRLTNNGAAQGLLIVNGQLYVNASYINTGELSATLIHGGTLKLGGANNGNGVMQVLDANGNVIGLFNNAGVDITDGTLTSYSGDRQTRALVSTGQIALQYYGQGPGPGWSWKNVIGIGKTSSNGASLSANRTLSLFGPYGVYLGTDSVSTQRSEISLDQSQLLIYCKNSTETSITLDGYNIILDGNILGPNNSPMLKASDIVNNLTSTAANVPLAAAQGKALKDLIAQSTANIGTHVTSNLQTVSVDAGAFATVASINLPAGVYIVTGRIAFGTDATGRNIAFVTTNGSSTANNVTNSTAGNGRSTLEITVRIGLDAAGTVYLRAYKATGTGNVDAFIDAIRLA